MVAVANGAEGGTDETTVTTANSGGDSGTAFDVVQIGTDASVVYDSAQYSHGRMSIREATGATSATAWVEWAGALAGIATRFYGRGYVRYSSIQARAFARFRNAGAQVARIDVNASGQIILRNGANSAVATMTAAMVADTWYRIEWDITAGAAQNGEVKLFTGNSTSPTETISGNSTYGGGAIDQAQFGNVAAAANLASMWLDSLQVNDTGYPGPAGTAGPFVSPYRRHQHYLIR